MQIHLDGWFQVIGYQLFTIGFYELANKLSKKFIKWNKKRKRLNLSKFVQSEYFLYLFVILFISSLLVLFLVGTIKAISL